MPAKRSPACDFSGKRACEISTVTKGWKTRADVTNQIRSLAWLTQTRDPPPRLWTFPNHLQLPPHSPSLT